MNSSNSMVGVYIRALENLAERLSSIRSSDDIRLNQFIKQDIFKCEAEVNSMIEGWKKSYSTTNNQLLHDILKLYQKDLHETEDNVRKALGGLDLEFIFVKKEMESVNAAIERVAALLNGHY